MRKIQITEKELAKVVVDNLTEWGWDIYQEVEGPNSRCDIVGKRDKILWAIECKLAFGLTVIEQAANWKNRANYVSIAVPKRPSSFGKKICTNEGVGILLVGHDSFEEYLKPVLHRKIIPLKLYEEQKTICEAGGNRGGHWTPFKRTVRNMVDKVRSNPGIEFNKLIKELDHHYSSMSSAKSCLRSFIGNVIPVLRVEIVGKELCVFLTGDKR